MRSSRALFATVSLFVLGVACASPALSVDASGVSHGLLTGADIPFKLAAGPAGSTTVGPANTSARSQVTGDQLAAATFNTTFANNTASSAARVRLTFLAWTGTTTDCVRCDLELRRGTTTSTQITAANGVVTQSQGSWVTFDASSGAQSSWHIYAVVQRTLLADQVVSMTYSLEVVPTSALQPSLLLHNMTMEFTV